MLTYITGDFLITAIAEGIARQLLKKGSVQVFFSGANKTEILSASHSYSHVIVCWQSCFPINVPDPDLLIKSVHPMTIVKAPDNIIEVLGDYTHVGKFTVPTSQFNQPPREISLIDGDGEFLP